MLIVSVYAGSKGLNLDQDHDLQFPSRQRQMTSANLRQQKCNLFGEAAEEKGESNLRSDESSFWL